MKNIAQDRTKSKSIGENKCGHLIRRVSITFYTVDIEISFDVNKTNTAFCGKYADWFVARG